MSATAELLSRRHVSYVSYVSPEFCILPYVEEGGRRNDDGGENSNWVLDWSMPEVKRRVSSGNCRISVTETGINTILQNA